MDMSIEIKACFLQKISQNIHACEEIWVWTFLAILASFLIVLTVLIWVVRTSNYIRYERQQALLADVVLAQNQETCTHCGSIMSNKEVFKLQSWMKESDSKTSPEASLPFAQMCNFCTLIRTAKIWLVFKFLFLAMAAGFWFFGIAAVIPLLCCGIIFFYFFLLFVRFLWALRFLTGARKNAFLCFGCVNRRISINEDLHGGVTMERRYSPRTLQVLDTLPPKHALKIKRLLKDEEEVLWAETMSITKYFTRNQQGFVSLVVMGWFTVSFAIFSLVSFIETLSVVVFLPVAGSLLIAAVWFGELMEKAKASYILTTKRAMAVSSRSTFIGESISSAYYAKMRTVILQKHDDTSLAGRVLWMRDAENIFTRIQYVSNIEEVGKIIRKYHPNHLEDVDEDIDKPLGEFTTPPSLDLGGLIKSYKALRFVQPVGSLCAVLFMVVILHQSVTKYFIALVIILGFIAAVAGYLIMNFQYRNYIFNSQVKQLELVLIEPSPLTPQDV